MAFSETFSAASSVVSTFKKLDVGRSARIASLRATSTDSSGTATVRFLLVDESEGGLKVIGVEDFTATSTAVRTDAAGSGGDYVVSMVGATSGNPNVDMAGAGGQKFWYVGVPVLSLDDITVIVDIRTDQN